MTDFNQTGQPTQPMVADTQPAMPGHTGARATTGSLRTDRQPPAPGTANGLVQALTEDLQRDVVQIPGFPDVAQRLNRALRAEGTSVKEIVALINSEPGLVSRLLQLANSVAFNPTGRPVGDLKAAVSRLGFRTVWSAASGYAIRQLQQHEWLRPIRPWLAEIWLSSNHVAAICIVLGRQFRQLADEAMVAGLLHRVGELYLLTHAQKRGLDIQGDPNWERIVATWQATIGQQIISRWGLPDHVAAAVGRQDAVANGDLGELTPFATLLSAAKLYNRVRDRQGGDEAAEARALLGELTLWGQPFLKLVADGHEQIEAIRRDIS